MRNLRYSDGQPRDGDIEIVSAQRKGRNSTTSIALPSSILANAQSPELRIYLAGQIARAAAIYCVDEIVIFEEKANDDKGDRQKAHSAGRDTDVTSFFKLVLEYLETPQYLRKHLIPVSPDLRLVGLLNPLGIPSHVSRDDFSRWREGVSVGRIQKHWRGQAPPTRYVDVGLQRLVEIDSNVPVGTRVTVDMSHSGPEYDACPGKYLFGKLVDRNTPRITEGLYWGYQVRRATCLSDVFSSSYVSSGYDLVIGTSERGSPISGEGAAGFALPEFSSLLIVFGGVHGLERSVFGDEKLEKLGIRTTSTQEENVARNVEDLFDYYLNTCPQQGSRTIRSEEAVLISLAALQPHLLSRCQS